MCAIFGSPNPQSFLNLYEINKHRGGYSYSIMYFDKNLKVLNIIQSYDEFPTNVEKSGTSYYLGHIQAPTDGIGSRCKIHPAHLGADYLYHNGQIKSRSIEPGIWDTEFILSRLLEGHTVDYNKALHDLDGSFACIHINTTLNSIKMFTNQTCALHSSNLDISSTKADGFRRLSPCTIYNFDYTGITVESEFDNIDRTYFIPTKKE